MLSVKYFVSKHLHVVRIYGHYTHRNDVKERISKERGFNLGSKITVALATYNAWWKDLLLIADTFRNNMADIKGDIRACSSTPNTPVGNR